jgi:hypothetical protein
MSIITPIPLLRLQRCPSCRSRRLEVAVYSDSSIAGALPLSRTLECTGCMSVVAELPISGPLTGMIHPAVLRRQTFL